MKKLALRLATGTAAIFIMANAQAAAPITGDVSIRNSACVGTDCLDTESFGFDTTRLKENNLRMHFDDTSSSASFPLNDWRIIINDSASGGASYFAIEDSTAARQIFRVDAGAPANSLYVDSGGDVGIGTGVPVTELHLKDGDTPTMRLEQDGSSGFTPQTWDVAGNEANFFVRDSTNGSALPFRIRPGAPSSAIDIAAAGNVGFGTSNATAPLHALRTGSAGASKDMLRLTNDGPVGFNMENTNASQTWRFAAQTTGFRISLAGSGGRELEVTNAGGMSVGPAGANNLVLSSSGNLTIAGTLTQLSDVNSKENFESLDGSSVLAKLNALPVSQWNYRHDSDSVQHIGPTAQDFHQAFALGADNKHLSPSDLASVAVVGVKEVSKRLETKVGQLQSENIALREKLTQLETLVKRLTQQVNPSLAHNTH